MPHNLQRIPEGTTHHCRQCGQVFTVAKNPNQSGLFCSRRCALKFSRSKIRTFDQRQADDARMMAEIRERQERNRVEAAQRHEADLAEQRRKSDEEFVRWKIREAEIAREMLAEENRQAESERSAATKDIESTVSPFLEDELNQEMVRQHQAASQRSNRGEKSPRIPSPVHFVAPSTSKGIFIKPRQ